MQTLSRATGTIAEERSRSAEQWRLCRALHVEDEPREMWLREGSSISSKKFGTYQCIAADIRQVSPENDYMPPTMGIDLIGVEADEDDWLFEDDRPWFL